MTEETSPEAHDGAQVPTVSTSTPRKTAKTLAEKVWRDHVVKQGEGDGDAAQPDLLYIDLHLIHEVTSPQAFEGLRLAGRPLRRPDLTIATEDHNTPTLAIDKPIADLTSRTQIQTLRNNCAEFGVRLHSLGDAEAGTADFGVVPIENSSEGAVNRTLDMMLQTSLIISGEVAIAVHHSLMTKSGNMDGVTAICAHSQALAQCQVWLNQNYPHIARHAVASNAEAARMAGEDATVAAIASELAGAQYKLGVIRIRSGKTCSLFWRQVLDALLGFVMPFDPVTLT